MEDVSKKKAEQDENLPESFHSQSSTSTLHDILTLVFIKHVFCIYYIF